MSTRENFVKVTAVVAAGAVSFGGAKQVERIGDSQNVHNAKVEHCASVLGTTAIRSETIPAACHDLSDSFAYEVSEVTRYSPDVRDAQELVNQTTYLIPTAESFREANIWTSADRRSQRHLAWLVEMAITSAGLGIATGSIALYGDRKRKANAESVSQASSAA